MAFERSVFARLFELREEANQFLRKLIFSIKIILSDKTWISKVAYLADIFSRLNNLNSSLQGYCINIYFLCATKLMVSKRSDEEKV